MKHSNAGLEADLAEAIAELRVARYAQAEALLERALQAIEADGAIQGERRAAVLTQLGKLRFAQGRYQEAVEVHRRALAINERPVDVEHTNVAENLGELALAYRAMGRFTEAEELETRALAMLESIYGPEHPSVAAALTNLGLIAYSSSRLIEAETFLNRAQQILKASPNEDPLRIATTTWTLGAVLLGLGRDAEAEQHFTRALDVRERTLGRKHPQVAAALVALAVVKDRARQVPKARELYQRALAIQEQSLGKGHPDVAYSVFHLGLSYLATDETGKAEGLLRRSLDIRERALGPDHPLIAEVLEALGRSRWSAEANLEAEALLRRALAIREHVFGPGHQTVADILDLLGWVLFTTGTPAEVESIFQRALLIRERELGPDALDIAESFRSLGQFYRFQPGRAGEAESLFLRALKIREVRLGANHEDVADLQQLLGKSRYSQRRYGDAAEAYRRAVTIRRREVDKAPLQLEESLESLGFALYGEANYRDAVTVLEEALSILERAPKVTPSRSATAVEWLANAYVAVGRTKEGVRLYERALGARENTDRDDSDVRARLLTNLASADLSLGRLEEAERYAREAVDLREKKLGQENLSVADSLFTLGQALRYAGRFAEAEAVTGRVVAIRERLLPDSPDLGRALVEMAEVYGVMWRLPEAEPLIRRALVLFERQGKQGMLEASRQLMNLGAIYQEQKRFEDAEGVLARAQTLLEEYMGPDDPAVAEVLGGLARLLQARNRGTDAETAARRALAIHEAKFGPRDLQSAGSAFTLAVVLLGNGRYEEAEALAERALRIREANLGSGYVVSGNLVLLARAKLARGRSAAAIELAERARRNLLDLRRVNVELDESSWHGIQNDAARDLREYVGILADLSKAAGQREAPKLFGHAFEAAEQIRFSSVQGALGRAAGRVRVGESGAVSLIRSLEQLRMERQALIAEGVCQGDGGSVAEGFADRRRMQQRLRELDERIGEVSRSVKQTLPRYAELAFPDPIDVQAVRRLLRADEGLISYLVLPDRLLIWLVKGAEGVVYREISVRREDLAILVTRVRTSIDQTNNPLLVSGRVLPFDVHGAFDLYRILVEPIKRELAGLSHLMVVPDDVLISLAFGALVTDNHGDSYTRLADGWEERRFVSTQDTGDYRALSWLSRQYSISVLPGATSLRGLRESRRRPEEPREPFIGVGDPELDGVAPGRGGAMIARGGDAAVPELRKLGNLPGTREELLTLARALGADPGAAVYLRDRATKPVVQELSDTGRLGQSRVLAFATHALTGGELRGLREPALVLTPPLRPGGGDDGLLRLSDIVRLKLDGVEWVILSACNTGGSDVSGEGLSGLVRAFFYGGASALLVSHWSVDDKATQTLMKSVFHHYGASSEIGKAEALRRGMMDVLDASSGDSGAFAHPFFWAGFFLVGDGGERRQ